MGPVERHRQFVGQYDFVPISTYVCTIMAGSTRAALKSINDAIRGQQYDDAVELARSLVKRDPKSYQGYVLTQIDRPSCATTQ